jgi:serine/threonine protein kinase/Tol biopolymer transport system component
MIEPGQLISHYKILEKLGEGGMGVVYRAEDVTLTRSVALKFLPHGLEVHEAERARFLQEARAAAILNHPNICTIHEIAEVDGQQFIVMEYVEGKTLRKIVPVKKLPAAIGYAIQIVEALQEAHSKGIVHRDIKAENIMVNSKNQVKVMDFGLAKLKGSLKLTKTSSTIGTLAYMAPEQIQGEEVDARSDIFSFGIVLYEMLTGHLPFKGEHEAAILYAIVNENPEPLQHYVPDAQSELLHILNRALEKDREERYQTVHDMLIDLRRLKKDSSRVSRQAHYDTPMPGTADPRPAVEGKKSWRSRLWLGIAALLVLCAISVGYFLLRAPAARLNPDRASIPLRIPFKEIGYPSLSRDGNWIAFSAKDKSEKWDLYMMNTAGGEARRITDEEAYELDGAAFSPDVSQIVYDCQQLEPYSFRKIKIVASQGGSSRTLADTGFSPKWRPDGIRIGYMRAAAGSDREIASASGKLEIWSIKPDGTDSRLELIDTICTRDRWAFCWSPDGESITWVRNYPEGYGEVMVRKLATGKERQLTADRKKVDEVIWASNDQILYVSNKSGQPNLWMIPAGGGEATQVTQGAVPIIGARISADIKTLLYMQSETFAHVWISSIDGSNARQVTFDDTRAIGPVFSPDRKNIALTFGDVNGLNPERHLYVMDRDGKNQRQLTYGPEIDGRCRWSPDGKWLAYTSRAVGEPGDSNTVYLIQPFNPGSPRMLCKGYEEWFDNESLLVFSRMKTRLYSLKAGTSTQMYQDSTWVFGVRGNKLMVFFDLRKGRDGVWVVPVDSLGRQKGEVREVHLPFEAVGGVWPPDLRFWMYRRGYEVWRTWISTGKEERIGKALPGGTMMYDVSMDGKEILWVSTHYPSKLVLVKDVFE